MSSTRTTVRLTMICVALASAWAAPALATTYYVAPGGSGNGSADSPWGSIQNAVASSSPVAAGDTIVVRTGTYALASAINFKKSGAVGNPITLVAEAGVVLNVTASSTPGGAFDLTTIHDFVIDGFRINEASHYGIGLHGCTNVTVQNCTLYRAQASAIIVNVTDWGTDDVYPVPQNWNIKLLGNTITQANWNQGDNEAISLWATDGFEIAGNALTDCSHEGIDVKTGARNGSVHHNTVTGDFNTYGGTGMGVYIDAWHYETYNIDVYQNVIHDSEEGFEINCEDCNKPGTSGSVHDVRIFNNVVYHNTDKLQSGWKGRGMSFYDCCDDGDHPVHDIHVFNNTFVGSQLLGIHVDNPSATNVFIRNNIIVNQGDADVEVDHATSVTVANNILSKALVNTAGAACTASGNTIADPLFVDAAGNDYHVKTGSPAIDKATGTDVPTDDFDGAARPVGAAADIGAFEFGGVPGTGGATGGTGSGGAKGSGGVTGAGGATGSGGVTGVGGVTGRGGASGRGGTGGRDGSAGIDGGGSVGIDGGGALGSDGAMAGGGTFGSGGSYGTAGTRGSGGSRTTGGAPGSGGRPGSGGIGGQAGGPGSGGATGTVASGGQAGGPGSGGTTGTVASGGRDGGSGMDPVIKQSVSSGCACRTAGDGGPGALAWLGLVLVANRLRRRRPSAVRNDHGFLQ